jgi:hypothetical protein
VRTDGAAVGHQLTGVFENDHAVAEKAPALLWERRDGAGGVVVSGVGGRAGRLVLAHRTRHGLLGSPGVFLDGYSVVINAIVIGGHVINSAVINIARENPVK